MWVYWLIDIYGRRQPMTFRHRQPKAWHPLMVMLTLLTVGFLLIETTIEQANKIKHSTIQTKTDRFSEKTEKTKISKNQSVSESKPQNNLKDNLAGNLQLQILLLLILGGTFFAVSQNQLDEFGFRKTEIGSQISDGCVGFLVSLAPVSLALFVSMPFRSVNTVHPFLKLVGLGLGWDDFALISFSAVVMAPLFEELVFRVLFQGFLQDRIHPVLAILFTSLAFGFIHGWPDMIPIFTFSLVLGYFFYRTNSYLTVVVLHALFNLYNLLNVLLTTS